MPTQCSQDELDFGTSGGRRLVGAFDGGAITSNGGAVLLGAADRANGLCDRLAGAFRDLRIADAITHTVAALLRQRIFGLALEVDITLAEIADHLQREHGERFARARSMAFSKLKALLKKSAAQTVDDLRQAIADALPQLTAKECKNYFIAAGYEPV